MNVDFLEKIKIVKIYEYEILFYSIMVQMNLNINRRKNLRSKVFTNLRLKVLMYKTGYMS